MTPPLTSRYLTSMTVSAAGGGLKVTGGSPAAGEGVQVVPGAGGEVIRLIDTDILITGVREFTSKRAFTIAAWVRLYSGNTSRVVMERATGSTRVKLEVTADGYPAATFQSTAGGYVVNMVSTKRVDDGAFHLVVVRCQPQYTLGIDLGGCDLTLWVDGAPDRKGWIHPGIFSRRPDFTLEGPMVVGRGLDGSGGLHGDLAALSVWEFSLPDREVMDWWAARPAGKHGYVGWGIPL